jgi:hypothetical protein
MEMHRDEAGVMKGNPLNHQPSLLLLYALSERSIAVLGYRADSFVWVRVKIRSVMVMHRDEAGVMKGNPLNHQPQKSVNACSCTLLLKLSELPSNKMLV